MLNVKKLNSAFEIYEITFKDCDTLLNQQH